MPIRRFTPRSSKRVRSTHRVISTTVEIPCAFCNKAALYRTFTTEGEMAPMCRECYALRGKHNCPIYAEYERGIVDAIIERQPPECCLNMKGFCLLKKAPCEGMCEDFVI